MLASSTVDSAHHELHKAFTDLKISVNTVYKHTLSKCNFSLKRAEILPEKHNSIGILCIEDCIECIDYDQKSHVLISDVSFSLCIMQNRTWVPTTKKKGGGLNVMHKEGICYYG